ncbi:11287_t:CDS:2, partial [Gigaspora margarita]
ISTRDYANIGRTSKMGLLAEIVNEIELEIKSLSGLPSSDEGGPESSSKKVTSSESKKQYQHGQQSPNKRRHIRGRSVAVAALLTRTTISMVEE